MALVILMKVAFYDCRRVITAAAGVNGASLGRTFAVEENKKKLEHGNAKSQNKFIAFIQRM